MRLLHVWDKTSAVEIGGDEALGHQMHGVLLIQKERPTSVAPNATSKVFIEVDCATLSES
jgi:hypothetical protein